MPDAPAEVPAPSFNLDGLADLVRNASPELAKQVDSELAAAPEAQQAPQEPVVETTTENTNQEPVVGDTEAASEPSNDASETEEKPLADELEELNRQSAAAKAKAEAPKAPEPAKPAEPEKAPSPTDERDKDLKLDERSSATLHPKTKKVIEERNQKIIAERNRADALAKEKEELAKQLEEAKKVAIPKEAEEELKTLRERIRELDITRDPALAKKYDEPVVKNNEAIITLLGKYGLGVTKDGKPDPTAVENLKQAGLNFNTLAPMIKKLSDAGEEESAETLRELLRSNIRLGREKEATIAEWKANYDGKRQQMAQEQTQQQEQSNAKIQEHASRILNEDIAALAKDFPYLNRPAAPLPTDTPAVAKAKQDAIAAYDATAKQITESLAQFDASKVTPDKRPEVYGRMSAAATQAVILRNHVLPRVAKELAELRARNAELESKAGKLKAASTLSRAHAAAASSPAGAKAPLPESMEDAAKQIAKEMGVSIG